MREIINWATNLLNSRMNFNVLPRGKRTIIQTAFLILQSCRGFLSSTIPQRRRISILCCEVSTNYVRFNLSSGMCHQHSAHLTHYHEYDIIVKHPCVLSEIKRNVRNGTKREASWKIGTNVILNQWNIAIHHGHMYTDRQVVQRRQQ